ncbi:MAG: efflux RND transporter permease subunit [Planctomycetota bacterium]|jgi:multidrug efflux pump subunit AcrB/tetratricopeptide (TPR) repeat protein|nr:efflux RND transporter permease subunit [Planctomycetota bacterium]
MIRRAVLNPVLANILMVLFVGVGFYALSDMQRQTFPNFSLDLIRIQVKDTGASPEDVEEGICSKIEEKVQSVEGVKKIESTALEGMGTVLVHLESGKRDLNNVMNEIDSLVDEIDFPEGSESPSVVEQKFLFPVIQLVLHGKLDERHLKLLAEDIRKDLLKKETISQVDIFGTRDYRVHIQLSSEQLERVGLTFEDVTNKIRAESLTLPAGTIRGPNREVSVRTVGERKKAREFEDIVLLGAPGGGHITLGQVARVEDGFDSDEIRSRFDDKKCVQVYVYRTQDEDTIKIAQVVRDYLEEKKSELPPQAELDVWFDAAPMLQSRLDVLFENMLAGLVLVFLVLLVFLGFRLSFWVSLGIPVCFLGSMAIVYFCGESLNMCSSFGFILVLGMLVDDAIVIGENVDVHYQGGKSPHQAAIDATREVAVPVAASSLTTIIAFVPSMFVEGDIGKTMRVMPIVVGAALLVSYIESILILPNHLAHSFPKKRPAGEPAKKGILGRIRSRVDRLLDWCLQRVYLPTLELCLRAKGMTIGVGVAALVIAGILVVGEKLQYVIMPEIDTETIRCRFELTAGSTIEKTETVLRNLEDTVLELQKKVGGGLVKHRSSIAGAWTGSDGLKGSRYGELIVALEPYESGRPMNAMEFKDAIRRSMPQMAGVKRIAFDNLDANPAGIPFEVRLVGVNIEELRKASVELQEAFRAYEGVVDVQDDDQLGPLEYQYHLKSRSPRSDITGSELAKQLRQSFSGRSSVTIQRGREDVDVVVELPISRRSKEGQLDLIKIRAPDGKAIPIGQVADRKLTRNQQVIRRVDRERSILVSARIDERIANTEQILRDLEKTFLKDLLRRFPGVSIQFGGQRKQTEDGMRSLVGGSVMAFAGIYCILALTFRSFIQPLIIMSIIPVSFFGAVVGLLLMGYKLSLISAGGLIGLMGIVVNDALVLVEFFNDSIARGQSVKESLLECGKARFRPIFLTSFTTFIGLVPMIFETSLQAQFLIPMAVTIAFGILFETAFILLLIPALLSLTNDLRCGFHRLWKGEITAPEFVEPAYQRVLALEEIEAQQEAVELPQEVAQFGPSTLPTGLHRTRETGLVVPGVESATPVSANRPKVTGGGGVTRIFRRHQGIDDLLQIASDLKDKEDHAGALLHYLAALRHDPNRVDIHVSMGLVRAQMGEVDAALASLDRAIELDPEDLDIRDYRAFTALRGERYELAISDLSFRIDADPNNFLALKARATGYLATRQYDLAMQDLEEALGLAPEHAEVLYLSGNVARQKREFTRAIEFYDRSLARKPDQARAIFFRGLSREKRGDLEGGMADYRAARKMDPDLNEAQFSIARCLLKAKQMEDAEVSFSNYLAICPERSYAYLYRGKARSSLGNRQGAVSDFSKFLEMNPESKERPSLERYIRQRGAR